MFHDQQSSFRLNSAELLLLVEAADHTAAVSDSFLRDGAFASTSSRLASIGARNILGPVLKDVARARPARFAVSLPALV